MFGIISVSGVHQATSQAIVPPVNDHMDEELRQVSKLKRGSHEGSTGSTWQHLEVFVIGGGCRLHDSKQACQIALEAASLSPDELQSVWILLLRHQAAACTVEYTYICSGYSCVSECTACNAQLLAAARP